MFQYGDRDRLSLVREAVVTGTSMATARAQLATVAYAAYTHKGAIVASVDFA